MNMRIAIVGVLISNVLLGNLCMMQRAMAAEVPPHDADCIQCSHHEQKEKPVPQASACAGHCLSEAATASPSGVALGSALQVTDVPMLTAPQWSTHGETTVPARINFSPPCTSTDSVVLRL